MQFWPQYLILALYGWTVLVNIIKHDETLVRQYNAPVAIIAVCLSALILGSGGFWAPLGW
jgi:hypothetical protein